MGSRRVPRWDETIHELATRARLDRIMGGDVAEGAGEAEAPPVNLPRFRRTGAVALNSGNGYFDEASWSTAPYTLDTTVSEVAGPDGGERLLLEPGVWQTNFVAELGAEGEWSGGPGLWQIAFFVLAHTELGSFGSGSVQISFARSLSLDTTIDFFVASDHLYGGGLLRVPVGAEYLALYASATSPSVDLTYTSDPSVAFKLSAFRVGDP